MQRAGLIEHWRQQFWPRADRCSETATGGNDGTGIQAISVSDMQGSFYLLAIGEASLITALSLTRSVWLAGRALIWHALHIFNDVHLFPFAVANKMLKYLVT